MAILIDGYNLLHVSGLIGSHAGPGSLDRSRRSLLAFLAAVLDPGQRAETTVVFDAREAPPGLPTVLRRRGITVRYAAESQEADDLIETLIQSHSAPKQLIVVSSDHRVQRAARRRKATAVDSELWLAEVRRRSDIQQPADRPRAKPEAPLCDEEVQAWLREFGDAASDLQPEGPLEPSDAAHGREQAGGREAPSERRDSKLAEQDDWSNPFPPGYGEDLLQDQR
jgi:predicted RNA-binding protein with PIN domain